MFFFQEMIRAPDPTLLAKQGVLQKQVKEERARIEKENSEVHV